MIAGVLVNEVDAVIEFHRLKPVVGAWRPCGGVVAGHAAKIVFEVKTAVTAVLAAGGQLQRRSAEAQVVEIVVGAEKLPMVIAFAKTQLRPDVAAIGARHMIRHEVQNDLHILPMAALHQLPKLVEALRRLSRIVRAHIEVVFDRVRTARLAFANVCVIRGLTDGAVIRASGLLEHAGEPYMRDTEIPERFQCGFVDVCELAAAVLSECAVRFVGGVGIPKVPHHELVDCRAFGVQ